MQLIRSSVGRKILMAVTGLILILFVIVHLLGNSSIFLGPNGINAYAEHLHALGPLVWIFRLVMLSVFGLHILLGITLTLENRAATPQAYAVKKRLRATFSGETMIFTGLILLAFVVYHLLHFTIHLIGPGVGVDAEGRADVFTMVVTSFHNFFTVFLYVGSMVVLFLHLSHGVQSLFQTLGLSNDKLLPGYEKGGKGLSLILLVGYISIPVSIILGLVKL